MDIIMCAFGAAKRPKKRYKQFETVWKLSTPFKGLYFNGLRVWVRVALSPFVGLGAGSTFPFLKWCLFFYCLSDAGMRLCFYCVRYYALWKTIIFCHIFEFTGLFKRNDYLKSFVQFLVFYCVILAIRVRVHYCQFFASVFLAIAWKRGIRLWGAGSTFPYKHFTWKKSYKRCKKRKFQSNRIEWSWSGQRGTRKI